MLFWRPSLQIGVRSTTTKMLHIQILQKLFQGLARKAMFQTLFIQTLFSVNCLTDLIQICGKTCLSENICLFLVPLISLFIQ